MFNKNEKESILVKCKNCGSNMRYSIEKKGILCESCRTFIEIKDTNLSLKKPIEIGKELDAERKKNSNENFFKCENCGADITLANFEISRSCPFCKSPNVIQTYEIAGIKPDKVLKFEFGIDQAIKYFENFAKKKFFAPRPFKKNIPKSDITAMYIPSFTFDAKTTSTYSGWLYRYESDDGHMKTVTFKVKSSISKNFRDIVVESSSQISQTGLSKILPFNFTIEVDYKPEYLLGFNVERYDNAFETSIKNANQIMKVMIKESIIKKHNADGVETLDINTQYSDYVYEYEILPVYFLRYKYGKKEYLCYMNGQTGKVGGKFPISPIKVTFVSLLAVLFVLLIIILSM